MIRRARITTLLALAAASLALGACGGGDDGDPIPSGAAGRLTAALDQFQAGLNSGAVCDSIDAEIRTMQTEIADLSDAGVGADVQDALADGVDHLRGLAFESCEGKEEEVETTPDTTPETITQTVPETTPETTTQTTPETTPEPEPLPEPPPDEGEGGNQFNPDNSGGVEPVPEDD